ncbi:MAG: hypothetical protein GYA51_00120 [Candidatus Methanofastidiosa archaeon]|jgi:hypothetical protein|nr:hypothetical protein [Candidatus Methanofastidiosa archaeon]
MVFSFANYTLRIKNLQNGAQLNIDTINNEDISNLVLEYIRNLQTEIKTDERNKRVIKTKNYNEDTNARCISGIFEIGEYGFRSQLIDSRNGSLSYDKKEYDADMIPFYFLFCFPRNSDQGIIILEKFKQYGIKDLLSLDINTFFQTKDPNIKIDLYPLVNTSLLERCLEEGKIKKIKFIKFEIPSDIADVEYDGHREIEGSLEYSIIAKKGKDLPLRERVRKTIRNEINLSDFMEVQVEYDEVKVELDVNGKRRTINLSNPQNLRIYEDIDEHIQTGDDQHPLFNSINTLGKERLNELLSSIRRTV